MKQKWMHSLTALLLAMALLLTLPLLTAQTARAVDLSQKCSLTINPGTFEDLKNANLQYDLYKIADAVASAPLIPSGWLCVTSAVRLAACLVSSSVSYSHPAEDTRIADPFPKLP